MEVGRGKTPDARYYVDILPRPYKAMGNFSYPTGLAAHSDPNAFSSGPPGVSWLLDPPVPRVPSGPPGLSLSTLDPDPPVCPPVPLVPLGPSVV